VNYFSWIVLVIQLAALGVICRCGLDARRWRRVAEDAARRALDAEIRARAALEKIRGNMP